MGLETALLVGSLVVSAAGTAYSAYSQHEAAEDQEKLQKKQAQMEMDAAKSEAANIREKGRRLISSQRAALASSGVKVDEGTGDALQQETRRMTEHDALAVLKEGQNRYGLLRDQAKMSGKAAQAAAIGGTLNTVSTVAKGIPDIAASAKGSAGSGSSAPSLGSSGVATRTKPRYSLLGGTGAERLNKYSVV